MDKLTEIYVKWIDSNKGDSLSVFQTFQAGFSAGAVSLRQRAQAIAQAASKPDNDVINKIGSLPDIPQ